MAGYGVTIRKEDLREVERMMSGIKNGYATVVSGAINETLKGTRTDTKAEIRKDVTVKAKAITKTIKLNRANRHRVFGALRSKGGFVPLIDYTTRQTKKGVSVKVRKNGRWTLYPSAFITTMKSGHKGVFSREKPPYRTQASNKLPWKRFGLFEGHAYGRLPIKQLFGPRVPGIFGKDSVMNPVLKKAGDRIHKELDRRLRFEMSKYR